MSSNKITNLTTPTVAADAANKSYVDTSIPIGGIIMWSGTIATIPTNWTLCNGANGTPDLRNRFVIGGVLDTITSGTGGSGGVTRTHATIEATNLLTGGNKDAVVVEHSHSITDPGHFHAMANGMGIPYSANTGWLTSGDGRGDQPSTDSRKTGITGTNNQGVDGTNKNLPPYYALAFIMRIS